VLDAAERGYGEAELIVKMGAEVVTDVVKRGIGGLQLNVFAEDPRKCLGIVVFRTTTEDIPG
ncbi:hypothetical protein LCGC14_2823590, partial [marine sediment metagenome]